MAHGHGRILGQALQIKAGALPLGDWPQQPQLVDGLHHADLAALHGALGVDHDHGHLGLVGHFDAGYGIDQARCGVHGNQRRLAGEARPGVGHVGSVHLVAHVDDCDALVETGIDDLIVVAADDGETMGDTRLLEGADDEAAPGQAPLLPAGCDGAPGDLADEFDIIFVWHLVAQANQAGAVGQTCPAAQRRRVGVGYLENRFDDDGRVGRVCPAGLHLLAHVRGPYVVGAAGFDALQGAVDGVAGHGRLEHATGFDNAYLDAKGLYFVP